MSGRKACGEAIGIPLVKDRKEFGFYGREGSERFTEEENGVFAVLEAER
jgi:hypothetical protein